MINLIGETHARVTPKASDLVEWATKHNLTHPVVADANFSVTGRFIDPLPDGRMEIGLPSMTLLAPGMGGEIRNQRIQDRDIEARLPR